MVQETQQGTSTSPSGQYTIQLEKGTYNLRFTYLGYEPHTHRVELKADQSYDVSLRDTAITTREVEIIGQRKDQNTESAQMGQVEMDMERIKKLPAMLGEVDIMKAIQLLPGVSSTGDGNSGMYVRGGGPDQNLILLDDATIYNPSHLFGFFSIFNADAVDDVNLIKGGMPAEYGGRLASVLDVDMKEGDYTDHKAKGGIGVISSKLSVEGPIKKNKGSFLLSGRRTYIDVIATPFIPDDSPFKGSGYYFYDGNLKASYWLGENDRISIAGYLGRDVFSYSNQDSDFKADIPWGNNIASLQWKHIFNEDLLLHTNAFFSDYQFEFQAEQDQFAVTLFSGIRDWTLKSDLTYYPNALHDIKGGVEYTYHTFTPSNLRAESEDVEFDFGELKKIHAHEFAAYLQDKYSITELLKVNAGLRFSYFQQTGPFTRYQESEFNRITDTTEYDRWENVADYTNLEPRVTARYKVGTSASLKAAYTRNYQYVHMTSISPVSLPTDVWLPSTSIVKPQIGDQYAVGYFQNFRDDMFETSVEAYYKEMQNLVAYEEGASPQDNLQNNTDNQLTFGDGTSYGVELFIKKRTGKFNGWIGYTWSKTTRQFDELNDGEPFPAKYDRRHDLSVVLNYDLNKHWSFGATFVYATGNAITLPVKRYLIEGKVISQYGERNAFRLKPYHRGDVSVTYTGKQFKRVPDPETGEKKKVRKKMLSKWNLSVYNVYNRANPYFIYFNNEGSFEKGTLDVSARQVSLFPILPSLSWSFEF